MARIRYVKPSFFQNEEVAALSFAAQRLYIGLWTVADRDGRLEYRPQRIKAQLMAYWDLDTEALLRELAGAKLIVCYVASGIRCIQISNFRKHQKFHPKEQPGELPRPTPNVFIPGRFEEGERQPASSLQDSDEQPACNLPAGDKQPASSLLAAQEREWEWERELEGGRERELQQEGGGEDLLRGALASSTPEGAAGGLSEASQEGDHAGTDLEAPAVPDSPSGGAQEVAETPEEPNRFSLRARNPVSGARKVATFPCAGRLPEADVYSDFLEELRRTYPGIDLTAETHRALQWILSNDRKRKTASGLRRYLTGWFDREQNRVGGNAYRKERA